jgi:hypothetical protein
MPFGVLANKVVSGKLYRDQIDVDALRKAGVADGIYTTNWGVFYYEAGEDNAVFQEVRSLLQMQLAGRTPVALSYYSRPGQLSDEPFWAIALSRLGLTVLPLNPDFGLQVTSPLTTDHKFDYESRLFSVKKAGRLSTGQLYHFAAMHPLAAYLAGVSFYRNVARIPLPTLHSGSGSTYDMTTWSHDWNALSRVLAPAGSPAFRFDHPTPL